MSTWNLLKIGLRAQHITLHQA